MKEERLSLGGLFLVETLDEFLKHMRYFKDAIIFFRNATARKCSLFWIVGFQYYLENNSQLGKEFKFVILLRFNENKDLRY